MQKAAMIELVSRRKNATDIFYQEKLFTEIKFIPSCLKADKLFQKTLWAQVIASIDSRFSTPQHRHLSWLFLSLFHELPFKFLSDRHLVDLILLWRLRETLYIDYDDSDSKRLLALLPSKQVSYFVTNPVANRLQLTDILGLIANRPISPEIEAFIDGFVQTLPVPIPIWDREKLAILQKIYCHMNSEQRKIIIKKCFESIQINSSDFRFDIQIVALSAIYADEQHAYDIFHGMIMIVLSDNFQIIIDNSYHNIIVMLRSLAHKLKSTTELLDLMLNTYHNLMHTQMLFCEILCDISRSC